MLCKYEHTNMSSNNDNAQFPHKYNIPFFHKKIFFFIFQTNRPSVNNAQETPRIANRGMICLIIWNIYLYLFIMK